MNYQIHHYTNGLRLVTAQYYLSRVDYFGIAVNVGSAYENQQSHGLAHFVEHTIFKGTRKHSSNYIINRIESIGGELNAYTNKEETVVYSVSPAGNLKRCMSVIADIVSLSVFPDDELEKERGVIAQEIDSYLDSPAEAIYDEVDERLFRGTPLAHNILGTKESISRFDSTECRRWLDNYFTPANSVVFYSGPLPHEKIVPLVEKIFECYDRTGTSQDAPQISLNYTPFADRISLGLCHQCHVATAFPLPGIDNEFQPHILLLSNILGGPGMNSWLNISMRESRGLVYTVEASTSFYQNAGSFVIYYGCDADDLGTCRRLVNSALKRIVDKTLSEKELTSVKRQYLGQLTVSMENRESTIMAAARSLLCRGRVLTADELKEKITGISGESLREAAALIDPSKASEMIIN